MKPKWAPIFAGLWLTTLAAFIGPYVAGYVHFPHIPVINTPKGTNAIALVDDTAPTIPQALVLDDNQTRSMRLNGMFDIADINDDWTKAQGYDQLLTEAGGAPALIILDAKGNKCYAGRYPTDKSARDKIFKSYLKNLPPPIDSPKSWKIIDRGAELDIQTDEAGQQFVNEGGHKRKLVGFSNPKKLAALPRYAESNPVFPENSWYELSRRNVFGSDWILDQDGISSCVGNGWAGAIRRARWLAGQKDVKLSPGFAYSLINHDQDAGAVISDGIPAFKKYGIAPFDLVGQKPFYQRQISEEAKTEAKRFRLSKAYQCQTWEETVSALLTGRFQATFGVMVGKTFGSFDKFGVCGHDPGAGNHCVSADGVRKLPDGRWVLEAYNSWGADFGAAKDGRMLLDKDHLFGRGVQSDVCVIQATIRDPNDPTNPPKYSGKLASDAQCTLNP